MIEIDVLVEDATWSSVELSALCAKCAEAIEAAQPELFKSGEVAALFTSDEKVRDLNREFRGKDKPTNVLSFPTDNEGLPPEAAISLGDLALASGVTRTEASEKDIPIEHHTAHLVVHGLLHLFGYDHTEEQEAEEMETLERQILARLDIPDPYA